MHYRQTYRSYYERVHYFGPYFDIKRIYLPYMFYFVLISKMQGYRCGKIEIYRLQKCLIWNVFTELVIYSSIE